MVGDLERLGWVAFDHDDQVADWASHARAAALDAVESAEFAQWHQCQGTWFVGIDALDNGTDGRVGESGPLAGVAVNALSEAYGPMPPLHRAQVSVIYPGYPRPREGEFDAAFGYRLRRDAAHVDGVLAIGPDRRRHIHEPHAWILGLPLSDASHDAAPLVVWEGSHHVMRDAFSRVLAGFDPADWGDVDVTETYQAARREVFDTCTRKPLPARTGQAVLLHRLALHGVAPWAAAATAGPEGRMIAYFRPEMPGGIAAWIGNA